MSYWSAGCSIIHICLYVNFCYYTTWFCSAEFDSTLGDETDIPLPTSESKEELDEEDEEVEEEIEEEEEEGEGDEGQENPREDEKGESGAETSESEAVMVSPRHSRAKSVTDVRMYCFVFVFLFF